MFHYDVTSVDDPFHHLPVTVVALTGLSFPLQSGANPQISSQQPRIQKSHVRSQPSPKISQHNITH